MFIATIVLIWSDQRTTEKTPDTPNDLPVLSADCSATKVEEIRPVAMTDAVGPRMDEHEAMGLLFANYNRDTKLAAWCPARNAEIVQLLYRSYWPVELQSTPAFFAHYQAAGAPHFIIIFQTERYFDGCHACTVVLGGAVFSKRGGQWYLSSLTRAIDVAGSYGRAPSNMALVKIGPNLHAVAVRDGYQQHGIYTENYLLLSPVGDRVERVLLIKESSGSNEGVCSDSGGGPFFQPRCYDYDTDLNFSKGSHPIYSDIEVTVEGTKYDVHDVLIPFKAVATYRFDGCRYTKGVRIDKGDHKPYYIQVGAFANYRSACNLVQELQNLGCPAYCQFNKPEKGNSIFRIRIGNYSSKRDAEYILLKIRQLGYRGFVAHR